MTSEHSTSSALDRALLRALRQVAHEMDAPPAEVVAGASAALAWRTIDSDLASLFLEVAPARWEG